MKKNKKMELLGQIVARLFFITITLAIVVSLIFGVARINYKVLQTQLQLAFIADEIRIYNENYIKTDSDTRHAKDLFQERRDLSKSEDPVIAFSAKHGFSVILFIGSIMVFVLLIYLLYQFFKNFDLLVDISYFVVMAVVPFITNFGLIFLKFVLKTLMVIMAAMAEIFHKSGDMSLRAAKCCQKLSNILNRKNVR